MIPSIVITIFDLMVVAAIVLCLLRMLKGPTAADRMVSIDLLGLLVAILMIAHVVRSGDETVLDVVLVFSIVAFFGTVTLAHYLQSESNNPTSKR